MKKLIIALLLCLVPLESYASSRADKYRMKLDPALMDEITDYIVNTAANSVDAVDKGLDWLHLHNRTKRLCFTSCVSGVHNGKPYNKNFCESLCEYSEIQFRAKVEETLKDHDSYIVNSMFRRKLISSMRYFFEEDKDNITITEASYVEPDVNCGNRCKAFLNGLANIAASVALPEPAYRVFSAVKDLM